MMTAQCCKPETENEQLQLVVGEQRWDGVSEDHNIVTLYTEATVLLVMSYELLSSLVLLCR